MRREGPVTIACCTSSSCSVALVVPSSHCDSIAIDDTNKDCWMNSDCSTSALHFTYIDVSINMCL